MSGFNSTDESAVLPEPYGHVAGASKLERYWRAMNDAVSLTRRRSLYFDGHAGMSFAPTEYQMRLIDVKAQLPADDWICSALESLVRTEFAGSGDEEMPAISGPDEVIEEEISDSILDELLAGSESFDQDGGESAPSSPEGMAGAIFDLLGNRAIGTSRNLTNNGRPTFVDAVAPSIREQARLLFVIPGLPFKDQNPFRVPFRADEPDLAEVSFLIRLHRLTQALYQIHPFGLDVLVLTDGTLYGELFGVQQGLVDAYGRRLLEYRNRLNLTGTVSMIPLHELLSRYPCGPSGQPQADVVARHIEARLHDVVRHPPLTGSFGSLLLGMKWNLATRSCLESVESAARWGLLRWPRERVDGRYAELWDEINDRASKAAYRYAAVNLTLRWLNIVQEFFPGAIRGTVHPKPGQFGLAGSVDKYAWNGVAWSKTWPRTVDDVEVVRFSALAPGRCVRLLRFASTQLPAFYASADE